MITLIPHHFMVTSLWSPALNKPKWFWPQARSPCYHHCCRASSWPDSDPSIPCGKLPRTHLLNSIKTQVTCETNLIFFWGLKLVYTPKCHEKWGKWWSTIKIWVPASWLRQIPQPVKWGSSKISHGLPELPTRYIIIIIMVYLIFGCTKMPLAARFTTKSIGSEFLARIARAPKKSLLGGSQKLVNWNTSWNTKNNSWLVVST